VNQRSTESDAACWIIHHDEAVAGDASPARIGGKAAALAALSDFDVPPWFAITPDAFEAGTDERREDLERAIVDAFDRLAGAFASSADAPPLVAVRSSATVEDGADRSHAGQFESLLRVPRAELLEAVRRVRASAGGERVRVYRGETDDAAAPAMAVLVQRMIEPICAGVAFTRDPVTGDATTIVTAVAGTAEGLVGGAASGAAARVDDPDADDSPVVFDEAERPRGFDDGLVVRIARLANAVAERRGGPQDLEWAFDGRTVHLLQARPVTGAPGGRLRVWDDSNIAESYEGVTAPLTCSFIRMAYANVYRTFCRVMGVPASVRSANEDVFGHMLGFHRGRVFYDLVNWYRLIAMLPGYRLNATFMEQMMGVRESLPAEARAAVAAGASGGPLTDGVRLARSLASLTWRHVRLSASIRSFERMIERALGDETAAPGITLEEAGVDELIDHYRRLERDVLPRWDAPILNDFFCMIHVGLLRSLCARAVGDEAAGLHNDLLMEVGEVVSIEPTRRVEAIAGLVRDANDAALLASFDRDEPAVVMERLEAHPAIRSAIDGYLRDFGDRCLQELKLERATLRDDSTPLLRSIAAAARRPARERPSGPDPRATAARERLAAALRGRPLSRAAVAFVLPRARARVRDRENLRFARTRVFGRVRRLVAMLGRRYETLGLLERAEDVFMLEIDEVLGLATGVATIGDPKELVTLRRTWRARWLDEPPLPSRFETRGSVEPLRPIVRPAPASASAVTGPDDEGRLRGIGCCRGLVRGRARVVTDPMGVELAPGDVLIASRTDPGWVMLFAAASAIAVEHGSILSHTSIVARELGVPCVVAVAGLLEAVRDGATVELDGSAGTVRVVVEPAGGAP